MASKEEIFSGIRNKNTPVIIYGAGVVGKVLLSVLEGQGVTVDCFCDNSRKVAQSKFCGKDVIFTPDLKERYGDAVFLISVASIRDVVQRLSELGYTDWLPGGPLLRDIHPPRMQVSGEIDRTAYAIDTCIRCHDGYLDPKRIFLRSLDLIITERCSLRCKDCSNLMQYYADPKNCDLDMLFRSIDVFFTVVDEVIEFRLLGGEAFIHKEWPTVVRRLTNEPKVGRIVIYTNGTIVPKETDISVLKKERMLVSITDYGPLSRKSEQLKALLRKYEIPFLVIQTPEWLDCAKIQRNGRDVNRLKEIYGECCAKNLVTLSDGKLFRCPYAANAARLSAVPDRESDYVDLFQVPLDASSVGETKRRVREYLLSKHYLETCDYCNGRPLSGREVPPAVQADRPMPYQKYD